MTKLYLAHPFDTRHRIREWELWIEEKTGIEIVNPFFDVERNDKELIDSEGATLESEYTRERRYGITDAQASAIVNRDVAQIAKCDGIIAIVDGSLSYGTIQEMVYAKALGKFCLSMISNGQARHPWLRHHSTVVFESLAWLSIILIGMEE